MSTEPVPELKFSSRTIRSFHIVSLSGGANVDKKTLTQKLVLQNQGTTLEGKNFRVDGISCELEIRETDLGDDQMEDVHGILGIYEVSDRLSFDVLKGHWAPFQNPADRVSGLDQPGIAPLQYIHSKPSIILLVGNKSGTSDRAVTEEEGHQLARTLGSTFMEISAEDETSVEKLLFETIRKMRSLGKGIFFEEAAQKASPRVGWCGMWSS